MSKIYEKDIDRSVLRRLQLTQVEILDEIVRICEKHGLRYYLTGGTLLGALRHKGFIPWDDDLDIAMPREDYIKFCEFCKTELAPAYMLHDISTDDRYWLIFAKVRKKGTAICEKNIAHLDTEKAIYVDIFPLDDAPCETSMSGLIRTKMIRALCFAIYYKRGLRSLVTAGQYPVVMALTPFSIKTLTKWQLCLMQRNNGKGYPYYINYGSNYNTVRQTILKDKYEPYKLAEFENKQYRIPNDADHVLRRVYRDYMCMPPEEKRVFQHKPQYIDFGSQDEEV